MAALSETTEGDQILETPYTQNDSTTHCGLTPKQHYHSFNLKSDFSEFKPCKSRNSGRLDWIKW